MQASILDGTRVVDFSTGVLGPYVTKLLADAGADVIKVEDGEGDPVRRWSATRAEFEGDSALFQLLNASKRGIVGAPGDPEIEELVATADVVARLVEAGVPAAPARDPRLQHENPQHAHRGLFEMVDHPAVGTHPMPGMPYRFASVDRWITSPSPTLGQHNHEILAELGLSADEIAALEADGVIGTRPRGL